jgi:hypothetical protein
MDFSQSTSTTTTLEHLQLEQKLRAGAGWFTWIAAFTLINSLIFLIGKGSFSFIIGLGATQLIDAFTTGFINGFNGLPQMKFFAFLLDIVLIGLFFLFGRLARQGRRWPFIIGMILYGLDSLIFLWVQDYLGLGFHAFALFNLYKGLQALEGLKALQQPNLHPSEAAQSTLF